jgi:hypothetical protein
MRITSVVAMLLGGCAVFVACAASNNGSSDSDHADAGAHVDAIADVLHDLGLDSISMGVPDADAAPPTPPTTFEMKCTKTYTQTVGASVVHYYAEHDMPGRSKAELAGATAIACGFATAYPGTYPAGYDCYQTLLLVRDGAVAYDCSTVATIASAYSIQVSVPSP